MKKIPFILAESLDNILSPSLGHQVAEYSSGIVILAMFSFQGAKESNLNAERWTLPLPSKERSGFQLKFVGRSTSETSKIVGASLKTFHLGKLDLFNSLIFSDSLLLVSVDSAILSRIIN